VVECLTLEGLFASKRAALATIEHEFLNI
jgi:hypothetical protein